MKFIRFCDEVIGISTNITFWIQDRGKEYRLRYCVNMSPLVPQNFVGEPSLEGLLRSEGYLTYEEANNRLKELLVMLNE
jgi:hypothetical protein